MPMPMPNMLGHSEGFYQIVTHAQLRLLDDPILLAEAKAYACRTLGISTDTEIGGDEVPEDSDQYNRYRELLSQFYIRVLSMLIAMFCINVP